MANDFTNFTSSYSLSGGRPSFQMVPVDEKLWYLFLGNLQFSSLRKRQPSFVVWTPGHIGLICDSKKSLAVLSAAMHPHLSSAAAPAAASSSSSATTGDSQSTLLQLQLQELRTAHFSVGPPLRIFCLAENGLMFSWCWSASQRLWYPTGHLQLPPDAATAEFHAPSSTVVWQTATRAYSRKVNTGTATSPLHLEFAASEPAALLHTFAEHEPLARFLLDDSGVWLVSDHRLGYYNLVVGQAAQPFQLAAAATTGSVVAAATVHLGTRELVVLLSRGGVGYFVAVATLQSGSSSASLSIVLDTLCQLELPPTLQHADIAAMQPLHLMCRDRLLVLCSADYTLFFDVTSGVAVGPAQRLPSPVPWCPTASLASTLGLVADGALYQLSALPAASQAANLLAGDADGHGRAKRFAAAVQLCADWGLDAWKAKYLLDFLLFSSSETTSTNSGSASLLGYLIDAPTRHELCDQILQHADNPGLVLALLAADRTSRRYVQQKVAAFLRTQGSADTAAVVDDEALELRARDAFERHTHANTSIADVLRQYLLKTEHLDAVEQQQPYLQPTAAAPTITTADQRLQLASSLLYDLPADAADDLTALPRAQLEAAALHAPANTLALLQTLAWRDHGSLLYHAAESPTVEVSPTGERSRVHLLFEVMCRLHFAVAVRELLPFVEAVAANDPESPTKRQPAYWYERAVAAALPPATHERVHAMSVDELDARLGLLQRAGQPLPAVHMLLLRPVDQTTTDRLCWLLQENARNDMQHASIFHLIVTRVICASSAAARAALVDFDAFCSRVFELAPQSITASQLLHLLATRATSSSPSVARTAGVSLSTIKNVLGRLTT